jgi:hypothetical protein
MGNSGQALSTAYGAHAFMGVHLGERLGKPATVGKCSKETAQAVSNDWGLQ